MVFISIRTYIASIMHLHKEHEMRKSPKRPFLHILSVGRGGGNVNCCKTDCYCLKTMASLSFFLDVEGCPQSAEYRLNVSAYRDM